VSEPVLLEEIRGGVAVLTMNRPGALNALSTELFLAIRDAFVRLDRRTDIGVVVLTGRGRAFCAGGDVNEMPASSDELTFEERVNNLQRRASAVQAIDDCSKVTVALVNGVAVGAGLALALACDFRIACASAKFITGYIRMGFSGDCGGIHLLTNLIGAAKAKELFLLSDPVTAEEALHLGLITRCVADAELENEGIAFAQRLAEGPRIAQRYMKQNFRNARQPLSEAIVTESVYLIRTALTDDHAEAQHAFREERKPIFRGR
jgi:2-(1,2-epoxy-1,2-dihydrophenyl)acetyl-CoA isomerase